jgi:hypothetical protein
MKPGLTPPAADPLSRLKDIHLPPRPGWWPPAPGWWLAALLLLGAGLALLLFRHRKKLRERPVRQALLELEQLVPPKPGADPAVVRNFLKQLSTLLRRFCLVRFPGERIADLYGREWVAFLADRTPIREREFFRRELAPLARLYAPDRELAKEDADWAKLIETVKRWLEGQKKIRRKAEAACGGES